MTEEKPRWKLGEVATQTAPVIIDTQDENEESRVYNVERAIVKILNEVEEIKSTIG